MIVSVDAIYENGVLRLLAPVSLPEHAAVRVAIETRDAPTVNEPHILQRLAAQAIDLGVSDLAEHHDFYLYGVEE